MLFGAAVLRIPWSGRPEAHADGDRARHLRRIAAGRQIWIETEDAYTMVRRLAREEGMLVGISTGRQRGGRSSNRTSRPKKACIVTIACDGADKYLSEHFWDD